MSIPLALALVALALGLSAVVATHDDIASNCRRIANTLRPLRVRAMRKATLALAVIRDAVSSQWIQ